MKKAKNLENYFWLKLCENIEKSSSKGTIKVLNSLLSMSEKGMIAKRLAAVSLIRSGKSYREIGRILWMSPSTVSAIKKEYGQNNQLSKWRFLHESNKNRKRKKNKAVA